MRIRDWSSDVCSSDLLVPSSGVAQGERMVTPNQFQGTLLLGTTRVPESSDPCNPSGSGWIMAIDPFTGRGPGSVFFDLNDDTKFDTSDKITVDGVDRKSVVSGKRVSVSVDLGGSRIMKKKKKKNQT